MSSEAKRQMRVRIAFQIDNIGLGKHLRISIGRAQNDEDSVAFGYTNVVNVNVFQGQARCPL